MNCYQVKLNSDFSWYKGLFSEVYISSQVSIPAKFKRSSEWYRRTGNTFSTVPHRKCQMYHFCHKNKCCQSNSPKQYKNTDLFTQKEYSWPHWSHSNSSLLFFLLLWNQCYQDCYFWVKNQCYYIAFLSNFGNIYFCDKHDPFDVCDAAWYPEELYLSVLFRFLSEITFIFLTKHDNVAKLGKMLHTLFGLSTK